MSILVFLTYIRGIPKVDVRNFRHDRYTGVHRYESRSSCLVKYIKSFKTGESEGLKSSIDLNFRII